MREEYIMELRDRLSPDEQVYWSGKKAVGVSVLEAIFNPFLIFAFIWGMFDFGFIGLLFNEAGMYADRQVATFMIMFFAVHLMPVWIYIRKGNGERNTIMVPLAYVEFIGVDRGIFDRICGTGDITWKGEKGRIDNISDYDNVCAMIKKLAIEAEQQSEENGTVYSSMKINGRNLSDRNYDDSYKYAGYAYSDNSYGAPDSQKRYDAPDINHN